METVDQDDITAYNASKVWYICTICNRAFELGRTLISHKRSLHGNNGNGISNTALMFTHGDLLPTIHVERYDQDQVTGIKRDNKSCSVSVSNSLADKRLKRASRTRSTTNARARMEQPEATSLELQQEALIDPIQLGSMMAVPMPIKLENDFQNLDLSTPNVIIPVSLEQILQSPDLSSGRRTRAKRRLTHSQTPTVKSTKTKVGPKVKRSSSNKQGYSKCHICGKLVSSLKEHARTHTGAKPFTCKHCGEAFSLQGNRNRHQLTHSKPQNKPTCEVCGVEFKHMRYLKQHAPIHNKGQGSSFQCQTCKRMFPHKRYLHQHEQNMHRNKKSFRCSICRARYEGKSELENHYLLEHKKKKNADGIECFECKLCSKLFTIAEELSRHMRDGHKSRSKVTKKKKRAKAKTVSRTSEDEPSSDSANDSALEDMDEDFDSAETETGPEPIQNGGDEVLGNVDVAVEVDVKPEIEDRTTERQRQRPAASQETTERSRRLRPRLSNKSFAYLLNSDDSDNGDDPIFQHSDDNMSSDHSDEDIVMEMEMESEIDNIALTEPSNNSETVELDEGESTEIQIRKSNPTAKLRPSSSSLRGIPQKCKMCGKKTKNMVQHHIRCHTDPGAQITCDYCSKMLNNYISKFNHEPKCPLNPDRFQVFRLGMELYECGICTCTYPTLMKLHKHQTLHTEEQVSRLTRGASGSWLNPDSHEHKKADSRQETQPEEIRLYNIVTNNPPFKCKHCNHIKKNSTRLNKHIFSIHITRVEGKIFPTVPKPRSNRTPSKPKLKKPRKKYQLSQPRRSEKPKQNYLCLCSICGKSFTSQDNHNKHMKIHTDDRPYKCTTCNATFKLVNDLTRHKVVHSDARPYKCSKAECDNWFKSTQAVRAHFKKYHGNHQDQNQEKQPKPFSCNVCQMSYNTADGLLRHTARGHEPKWCTVCGKAFTDGDYVSQVRSLKHHMTTHRADTPYKCSNATCDKQFKFYFQRKTHLKYCEASTTSEILDLSREVKVGSAVNYESVFGTETEPVMEKL